MLKDATDKIYEPEPIHGLGNPVHEKSLSSEPTVNVGEVSGENGAGMHNPEIVSGGRRACLDRKQLFQ